MIRRAVRLLVGAILVLGVALVCLAHTRAGFRSVVLPLASYFAELEIDAEDGWVNLGGELAAEGFSLRMPVRGPALKAGRVKLSLAPGSLLGDGPILLKEVRLEDAVLDLRELESPVQPLPEDDHSQVGVGSFVLPVWVEQVHLDALTVTLLAGDGSTSEVDVVMQGKADGPGVMQTSFSIRGKRGMKDAGLLAGELTARGLAGPADQVAFEVTAEARSFQLPVLADFLPPGTLPTVTAGTLAGSLNGRGVVAGPIDVGADLRVADLSLVTERAVDLPLTRLVMQARLLDPKKNSADLTATLPGHPGKVVAKVVPGDQPRVSIEVREIDLTPWLKPVLDAQAGSEPTRGKPGEAAEAGPSADPATAAAKPATNPSSGIAATVDLRVIDSRYREVRVDRLDASLVAAGGKQDLEVSGSGVVGGSLQAQVHLDDAGQPRIRWKAKGDKISLTPLMKAFAGETSVGGVLVFESDGLSKADFGQPAVDGLDGKVVARLTDGKLAGFESLDRLAKATGLSDLSNFVFSEINSTIDLADGVATIQQLDAGGMVANLSVSGSVDLRGEGKIDVRINPRIGPQVASKVKGLGPLDQLVSTTEGLLALPIVLRVTGPLAEPRYAVRTQNASVAVSSRGGALVESILDGVTGGGASRLLDTLVPGTSSGDATPGDTVGR